MNGVKKIILGLFSILSFNFVSAYAYAGNYNNFGLRGLFANTMEYIPMAIAFLVIFWVLNLAINRTRMKNSLIISLILSTFATYGLTKLNIPIDNLFYKIGFNEELLLTIGPWIVLGLAMFIVWKWGFGKLLIIFGLIFLSLGIFKIAAESGAAIMIGSVTTLIGLLINKREMRKRKLRMDIRGMNAQQREAYLKDRGTNRDRTLAKWNNAGRGIGKGLAGTAYYGSRPAVWAGRGARAAGKGLGTAANWTGKGIGSGASWTGRGIKRKYKEYTDPREQLAQYKNKINRAKEKVRQEKEKIMLKLQRKAQEEQAVRDKIALKKAQAQANIQSKKELRELRKRYG